MATRQIALLGGGFSDDPDTLVDDFLLAAVDRARPKVCFVPTASGDSAGYIDRFYTAFGPRDCTPMHLSLFRRERTDLEDLVLSQNIVYVGGGNTANLLALWRLHGLDRVMRKAYENGVLLCGISAGAACWFEACLTDSFGEPAPMRDGLGLLRGSMCPHYDSEPERRPALHAAVGAGDLPGGWALDDGVIALFRDGEPASVATRVPGAALHRVDPDGAAGVRETTFPAAALTS